MITRRIGRTITTVLVIAASTGAGVVPASAGHAEPECHGHPATITGTDEADRLSGTAGRDVIQALGGDDTIRAERGDDLVCGGSGIDSLHGGKGADRIDGEANADTLRGSRGDDRVIDRRNDKVWDDGWYGDPNKFIDGPGSDVMRGRTNKRAGDWLSYQDSAKGVTLDWQRGTAQVGSSVDHFAKMVRITGSPHDDRLLGRNDPDEYDEMAGRGGNDHLRGRRGDDFLSAHRLPLGSRRDEPHHPAPRGHDTLRGGSGDDTLTPGGGTTFPRDARVRSYGGKGSDQLVLGPSGGRAHGGPARDELFVHVHHAIDIDLETGSADGMPMRFESIWSHHFDVVADGSTVAGTNGPDRVDSGNHSSTFHVNGRDGDDVINTGGTIAGAGGDDRLGCVVECDARGGSGADRIDSPGTDGTGTARGGQGDDSIDWYLGPAHGGPGDDSVASSGTEDTPVPLTGGRGNDDLHVNSNRTVTTISEVVGGDGDDFVWFREYADYQERLGLTIDLGAGTASGVGGSTSLIGIENAVGSPYDDTLLGDDGGNVLDGTDGTDSADGRGGTDRCRAEEVVNCEARGPQ